MKRAQNLDIFGNIQVSRFYIALRNMVSRITRHHVPDSDEKPGNQDIPEDIPFVVPKTVAPKRKPGRPAGARNKGPPKPRAKKVVVSEAVAYAPPPSPEPPPPRWDARHQPIPVEAKTEMAELMLRLLSGQSAERHRRKDALRRSWFA